MLTTTPRPTLRADVKKSDTDEWKENDLLHGSNTPDLNDDDESIFDQPTTNDNNPANSLKANVGKDKSNCGCI